jgi:uncharacterized protein (TIGR00369 family)
MISGPRQTMSGLEYMRQMQAGRLPASPMAALLKIEIVEVEEGRAVLSALPAAEHTNGIGIVHGGLAATLLDTALGCAVNSLLPAGRVFTTLEMKVNFTRPIRDDMGPLRCEARVVHAGRRTATAEGRVVDDSGKLYAHASGTWIVFGD